MDQEESAVRWPMPAEGQSRMTLLGCPHLSNPGNDEHNVDVDDTLAADRQEELETICERLEAGNFDHVAVEIPWDWQDALDEQYEAIRNGVALDDAEQFPDEPAPIRSETVQIGFRLADALDHDRVAAVDSHPPFPDVDADWSIDIDADAVPYSLPDMAALVEDEERRMRNSTLVDVLRAQNRGEHLRTLHEGNVAASLSSSDGEEYVGSQQAGYWYERNARILENLHRVTGAEEDTLFVVGASHVLPVKQLAEAFPATCPQSPLPLLE